MAVKKMKKKKRNSLKKKKKYHSFLSRGKSLIFQFVPRILVSLPSIEIVIEIEMQIRKRNESFPKKRRETLKKRIVSRKREREIHKANKRREVAKSKKRQSWVGTKRGERVSRRRVEFNLHPSLFPPPMSSTRRPNKLFICNFRRGFHLAN